MTFNQWVVEERARQGLTLDDLSASAGVSKSYIHDIENKGLNPSINKAACISRAMGFDLWKVLKKTGI